MGGGGRGRRGRRRRSPYVFPLQIAPIKILLGGHFKAIITTEEVLLRDPYEGNLIPIVEVLRRRFSLSNIVKQEHGDGKENLSGQHDVEGAEEDKSLFEIRTLEVALEEICSFLDARTTELEIAAYLALDVQSFKEQSQDTFKKIKRSCMPVAIAQIICSEQIIIIRKIGSRMYEDSSLLLQFFPVSWQLRHGMTNSLLQFNLSIFYQKEKRLTHVRGLIITIAILSCQLAKLKHSLLNTD